MNSHDRQNIEFIRSLSSLALKLWFEELNASGDTDEIQYALQMMQLARSQIELEVLCLIDEEAEKNVKFAAEYLRQFQLQ